MPRHRSFLTVLVLGLVAAALTIASFLAQTYKILRTREVQSLSAPMWLLSSVAFAVWVAYGVALSQWPIVIPNAVCCVLASFILTLKLLPTTKRDAVADTLTPGAEREATNEHAASDRGDLGR